MDNAGGDEQKLLDAHDQTCIMLAFVWYRDVTYCELLMERIDPSNNTLSTPTLVIFEQSACKNSSQMFELSIVNVIRDRCLFEPQR